MTNKISKKQKKSFYAVPDLVHSAADQWVRLDFLQIESISVNAAPGVLGKGRSF